MEDGGGEPPTAWRRGATNSLDEQEGSHRHLGGGDLEGSTMTARRRRIGQTRRTKLLVFAGMVLRSEGCSEGAEQEPSSIDLVMDFLLLPEIQNGVKYQVPRSPTTETASFK